MTEQQFTKSLRRSTINFYKERLRHVLGITETMSGLAERPSDQYVTLKADHLDCLFEQISESIDSVWLFLDYIGTHIAVTDPAMPEADDDYDYVDDDYQGNMPVCHGVDMSIIELYHTLKRCTSAGRRKLLMELVESANKQTWSNNQKDGS